MHKTKLQPKTPDFEGLFLLPYPYPSADNSSPLTEKEKCCERERSTGERKRDAKIVRENPNHGWAMTCGIRNGLTFTSKI